jgi:hypothetical protein
MNASTEITSTPEPLRRSEDPGPSRTVNESQYGIHDWQAGVIATTEAVPPRETEVKDFYQNLWPASEPYISVLNPVFLVDLPKMASPSEPGTWFVRDGLLPLIWFFQKNPEPGSFTGILRVDAEFEEFVPDAWRTQVELYEIFQEASSTYGRVVPAEGFITDILLLGLVMPSACSLKQLEADLEDIVDAIGGKARLGDVKIRAFLSNRFEAGGLFNAPAHYNRFMMTICKYLGTNIDFLEYEALKWTYLQPTTLVHEFNEKLVYSDSFLKLIALSKGGQFLLPQYRGQMGQQAYDKVFPLYPHVSCGIRKHYTKPFMNYLCKDWVPESPERAKIFYSAMNSAANTSYKWAKWITSWCKDFAKSEVTQ